MARFIHFFSLVGLCALFSHYEAHAKVIVTRDGNRTIYDVTIDSLNFSDVYVEGVQFRQAKITGVEGHEGVTYRPGHPEIPVARWLFEGNPDIQVDTSPEEWRKEENAIPWLPSLIPVQRSVSRAASLVISGDAYRQDRPIPSGTHSVELVGSRRGTPVRMLTLHPVRYRPSSGQYVLIPRFRVTFEQAPAIVEKPKAEGVAFVVGSAFENSPALQRYMDHKVSMGFRVQKIVLGEKLREPAAIRTRLRAIYSASKDALSHVLLVGDVDQVPGFESPRLKESDSVTDHYYRCLDTEDYEADVPTPDVSLGRLAVATEAELSVVVEKQSVYERGNFADSSWIKRAAMIGTDDSVPEHYEMAESTLSYAIEKYLAPGGFLGDFPLAAQLGGDRLYAITHQATREHVLKSLQAGRGLVDYGGHGSTDSWAGPELTIADVKSLKHPHATPFVASHACYTGRFVHDSFGEAWLRHRHGSILFWGSMEPLYWHPADDLIGRAMFDAPYLHGKGRFDELMNYAIEQAWQYLGGQAHAKYLWETYVVLGDPALPWRH